MRARKQSVPPELKSRVSETFVDFVVGSRTVMRVVGTGLAGLGLFGPLRQPYNFNGLIFLVGPWVCPAIPALVWTLHPFRPYRGSPFVPGTRSDIDTSDSVVMLLVGIYKSKGAVRFIWLAALRISVILFAVLGLSAIFLRHSLSWSLLSPWLLGAFVGGTIGSSMALTAEYLAWGLDAWVREVKRIRPAV